jgi:uncharacterized protein
MTIPPSDRARVRRKPDRGHYDQETIYSILDQGLVCHIAFILDGAPTVIPTAYGRLDNSVYIHGARSNRALKALAEGTDACVEVTLLDALVAGRSPMRHSMNYRSVVAYGHFEEATTTEEKLRAVEAIVSHTIPGRLERLRAPTQRELAQTRFLSMLLSESSAKIRSGPPNADPDDDLTLWAGLLPIVVQTQAPVPTDAPAEATSPPSEIINWSRGKGQAELTV